MIRLGTRPRPVTPRVQTREPYAFIHINKCAGSSIEVALGIPKAHATAETMRAGMGPDAWARHFSFAVVRHPVDRIVAVYFHRLRIGHGGLSRDGPSPDDWVRAVYEGDDSRDTEGARYLGPSADWVSDSDGIIVDEILRFEDLSQGWQRIAKRLGVCPFLPFLNVNPHEPWQEALSAKGQQIVADALSADFDLFGYEM